MEDLANVVPIMFPSQKPHLLHPNSCLVNASSFHLSTCKGRTIPTSPKVHFKNFLILIEGFEIIHSKLPQETKVVSLLLL